MEPLTEMPDVEWTIPSEFGREKKVLEEAADNLQRLGVCEQRQEDMLTALAEACLNAMEHGNALNAALPVKVTFRRKDGNYIFDIYDHGTGFDDAQKQAEVQVNWSKEQPRGWGLLLIHSLADEVRHGFDRGLFYIQIRFEEKAV